ncbi:MAG: PDGLE domain-containing protein [Anaerolineae bacterium]|mgnify:CR=1 FL=1
MKSRWWIIGLLLALVIAALSPLASAHPDGLERVAEDHEFADRARGPWYELIPDYVMPGVENEGLATVLAGFAGTLLLFLLMFGLGRLLTRGRSAS